MKAFAIIILLLYSSCEKKGNKNPRPADLPAITLKGLNTFGCLVAGKALISQDGYSYGEGGGLQNGFKLSYYKDSVYHFFLMGADNYNNLPSKSISIEGKCPQLQSGDKLIFNNFDYLGNIGAIYNLFDYSIYNSYITKPPITGELNLLLVDTVNHIISGTFFFNAIDTNSGKTITVTDGRFDGKY